MKNLPTLLLAKEFHAALPEFNYQKDYLRDMPGQTWTLSGKSSN